MLIIVFLNRSPSQCWTCKCSIIVVNGLDMNGLTLRLDMCAQDGQLDEDGETAKSSIHGNLSEEVNQTLEGMLHILCARILTPLEFDVHGYNYYIYLIEK